MRASYLIVTMITQQSVFSTYSRTNYMPTTLPIMLKAHRLHLHPLKQLHPCCQVCHRRSISQHTTRRPGCLLMNLKSILSCHQRVLTDVILSSGGKVGTHSFITCLGLFETFSQYLLCVFLQTLLLGYCLMYTQDQPLWWSRFFPVVEIQYHCVVLV
jgi:hypothetical protein